MQQIIDIVAAREAAMVEPVIDFLAEAELKAAEQLVAEIFEVKQVRQCRSVVDRKDLKKARMTGKQERVAKLVKDIRAKAKKAGRRPRKQAEGQESRPLNHHFSFRNVDHHFDCG